ncbi:galactonate dehydratase [Jiangella rhizosphaerae]|uniref:Galactonate dehydratase n=1 Tax=Jiangella rhizosphaerae TaxID=2293569 RepID=A0A418KGV7_9ACTN|nr:galactonate dehydratase [Jiangella rhizosphaerae]RIQ11338.1 galactonate dehydratase [Jiangella rhizosphaerae]
MKITKLETFLVPPRTCLLRMGTDEGIIGWGEPVLEGRAHTVAAAVAEFADYLVGQDPLRIEQHWQVLTKGGFYRGGPVLSSAVAGVDQALWDIAGKVHGVPVHRLLGGPVRDRVRLYAHLDAESGDLAEQAAQRVEAGFTAVKTSAPVQHRALDSPAAVRRLVDDVATIRDAVGTEVDVAVDLHGRLSLPAARRVLPLLEPLLPLFAEEPVVPEQSAQLAQIVDATSIPIATGERLYSRWDFAPVLSAGVAVVQPDASHAGGISEVRRIAAQAELHDATLAPHCPLGPIALAACLQLGFAVPNFLIQEQVLAGGPYDTTAGLGYLADTSVFSSRDGYIKLLTGPGLGIEIDEKAVIRAAELGHRWRTPQVHHDDGSRAEW